MNTQSLWIYHLYHDQSAHQVQSTRQPKSASPTVSLTPIRHHENFFDFIVIDSDQYFKVKIRQWSTRPEKVTFTIWIMDRTHRLRKRTELNQTLNAPTQTYQAQPIRIQNPRPDVPLEIDQLPINPNEIIYLEHPHRWASNISGSSAFWAFLEIILTTKFRICTPRYHYFQHQINWTKRQRINHFIIHHILQDLVNT